MEPKVNVQNMFSTPVMVVDNVLANLSSVNKIAELVYERYSNYQRWDEEKRKGNPLGTYWYSNSIVQEFPEQLMSVLSQLQPHVDAYTLQLTGNSNIRAVPVKDWLMFYDTNSGCVKHHHLYRYVDGIMRVMSINVVLYIRTLDTDTLNIYWPSDSVQTGLGVLYHDDRAHVLPLKQNRALILPAWVPHGADPINRSSRKIVMSINYEYINTLPKRPENMGKQ